MELTDIIIYITLAVSSFVNIVVPISGSAVITPFLAIFTDPHRAIGLASFFFLLGGIVRVPLFQKDIQWREIKVLLPVSLLAAFVGSLSLVAINSTVLLVVVLAFAVYFFLKRIKVVLPNNKNVVSHYTTGFVGLFSGFLQGAGLAGSDLRNSYLFGKNLNIAQVHGTTALVGASNFFVATVVRLFTDQLTVPDLIPVLFVLPFVLVGTLLGRKALYRLSEKTTSRIIVAVMALTIVFLARKILLGVL